MTANETPAATLAFVIRAWFNYHAGPDTAQHAIVRAETETREQANAIAALFPKSYRVTGYTVTSAFDEVAKRHYVGMTADFVATGATGSKNETSIKRYRSFIAKAEKLGFAITFSDENGSGRSETNQYANRESFEYAL